jgi:hypothetical protein
MVQPGEEIKLVTDVIQTPIHWRRLVAFALFALCIFTALTLTSTSKAAIESPPPPQVWSDKADYAPGETVTLSGANWAAGESVHIRVNDDAGQTWSRDVDVIAADDGTISDQFNLPNWFVAQYTVTATGAASGTATWTFTDGNLTSVSGTVTDSVTTSAIAGAIVTCTTATGCNATISTTTDASGNYSFSGGNKLGFATNGPVTLTLTVSKTGYTSGTITLANVSNGDSFTNKNIALTPSDTTAPTTIASPSPAANAAGWNNTNVSVSLSATDNAGGTGVKEITYSASGAQTIGSTTVAGNSVSAISLTAQGTTTLSFFAKDNAGNTEATKTFVVKIDKTAPSVSATPSRADDSNGWYNHSFSVTYSGTDGPSGIDACSAATSYSGPDTSSGSVSGSCTDKAGNSASASFSFKYDATAPTVSVTPDRGPDHSGWYNHSVVFSAAASSNGPSGAGSCDVDETYSGPDNASASVSMDCTDGAGNTGTGSASFQYDGTDPSVTATPSRPADHNGWYNHAFSVSYSGTDDTSDIDECDTDDDYSGPDTSSGSVSGSCTDNAGNSGSASYSFKYDATNPTISATLTPAANGNGWNNTDVNVHFTCSDNLSGIDPAYGCPADQTPTSEGLHTLHVATADEAGNVVTPSFDVRIDKTNPTINGSASPAANSYGWNNTSVTVSFSCADGLSGLDSCESDHVLSSEGAGQSVTGHAKDNADNEASATVSGINIDKTKPVVAVTGVSNGGVYTLGSVPEAGCSTSDALSGVKTAATLSSSGGPVGSITASCNGAEDKAGNTNTASVTYTVNYNWKGFFQPVDNLPALNKAKAGSSIPVKFSLTGNQGLSIFASGYPTSAPTTCGSTAAADPIEETLTAGGSTLNYDATADQYVYVWKTNSSWSNSCRTLTVKLVDGTTHQANFYFVK